VNKGALLSRTLLSQTATVYGENAQTGRYTTVLRENLSCRLTIIGSGHARTADGRAELAALRRLVWDPSYVLPEFAQVEVAGVVDEDGNPHRWNPVSGSFRSPDTRTETNVLRACDVMASEHVNG
jgi:hypothetical protein